MTFVDFLLLMVYYYNLLQYLYKLGISIMFKMTSSQFVLENPNNRTYLPKFDNFSYENLYKLENTISSSTLASVKITKTVRTRKNINELKPEEKDIYKNAIEKAISLGEYQKFVTIHSQYMMEIHSSGTRPNQRFLPWHRTYLAKFEELLNTIMKKETGKDQNLSLPYWDWEQDRALPEFFKDIKPTMDIDVYLYDNSGISLGKKTFTFTVKRFPGTAPRFEDLPTEQLVNQIKNNTKYTNFAYQLEIGKSFSFIGPHATVHMWVGGKNPSPQQGNQFDVYGAMAQVPISPIDICFWSHHANIDRIWASWQMKLENEGNTQDIYPDLTEQQTHMVPWPDVTEPQTRNIDEMGYTYDKI
jgi:tyrosinase